MMAATTPATQAETSRRKPCGKGKSKVGNDYISVTAKRRVAFSKRKAGLMKKASELASMTGSQVLVVVVSEAKSVYAYSTPDLSALIHSERGQEALQACVHTPQGTHADMQTDVPPA